jgi:hypothetical protein
MMVRISNGIRAVLAGCVLSVATGFAAAPNKTLRVEHGRPVVVVSERSVLLLEFVREPTNGIVAHDDPAIRHHRARFRWRLFDGASGTVTNGEGMVEEIYRKKNPIGDGGEVTDIGSKTSISAGEFGMAWSIASAGVRSWLYYHANSNIRLIQQPQRLAFDAVDDAVFRRYLASRNVQEFVSAGRTAQIIGPAVFTGDLPDETPVSARVESCFVHDGTFELKLANLEKNKHYVIDSSYEAKGNWAAVHDFVAGASTHRWSDPLGKDVTVAFYRIRQAAY